VRFGLAAVKNVGSAAAAAVVRTRGDLARADFQSLAVFCEAIDWAVINRRAVETLVKAGAFEALGDRATILAALESTIAAAQKRQRASARGQMDLFGTAASAPAAAEPAEVVQIPSRQVLEWERELLGTYMSDHPLTEVVSRVRQTREGASYCEIAQLENRGVGSTARLLVLVSGLRRIVTSSNRSMAVASVEDLSGQIDVVLFPDAFDRHGGEVEEGRIIEIRGRIDRRAEQLQIVCESVSDSLPEPTADDRETETLLLRLGAASDPWLDIRVMQQVDEILRRHEGMTPVVVEVPTGKEKVRRLRSRTRRVEWTQGLQEELRSVIGIVFAQLMPDSEARLAS